MYQNIQIYSKFMIRMMDFIFHSMNQKMIPAVSIFRVFHGDLINLYKNITNNFLNYLFNVIQEMIFC